VRLSDGSIFTLRQVRPDDAARLGQYFLGLSAETRRHYAPHPFDQATADAICRDPATRQPAHLVAVASGPQGQIVAYILLWLGATPSDTERYQRLGIALSPDTDAALAPSVADEWQGRGRGAVVMCAVVELAQILGMRRIVLWYGVHRCNLRAVHFYTKLGFRKVGEFVTDCDNDDMILEL
jgi:GNAT superfamily N-acetyltransferase